MPESKDPDPQLDEYLAGENEISRLYREKSVESTPYALDEKIMVAARRELRPRMMRWMVPMSVAAVTVFAVSIVLHMQRADISPLPREKIMAASPVTPQAMPPVSTNQPQAPAAQMKSEGLRDQTPATQSQAIQSPAAGSAVRRELPTAGAAPPAPVPLQDMNENIDEKKQAPGEPATFSSAPAGSEEGDSEQRESAKARAVEHPQDSAAGALAQKPAAEEDSPDAWIDRIERLRKEGKDAEAKTEFDAFHSRYPDYALPADLQPGN